MRSGFGCSYKIYVLCASYNLVHGRRTFLLGPRVVLVQEAASSSYVRTYLTHILKEGKATRGRKDAYSKKYLVSNGVRD